MTPLEHALERFLEALAVLGQTPSTVRTRRISLRVFIAWCAERGIDAPGAVTPSMLERYQRHLFYYRVPDTPARGRRQPGQPLSISTQHGHLAAIKLFFRWLTRQRWIGANPASELELPRVRLRIPRAILTHEEVERVLAHTQQMGELGVRDRAILETLYASGIRSLELAHLDVYDVDTLNGTLMVREGKGGKDRLLPIGARACRWIDRYVTQVRPQLLVDANERTLFLTFRGVPFTSTVLGMLVRRYFVATGIAKAGACHLFRHTMATAMLDNGADIRFIQAMLGHADLNTTTIYTRVALNKLREVYERTHPARMVRTLDAAVIAVQTVREVALLDALEREANAENDDTADTALRI